MLGHIDPVPRTQLHALIVQLDLHKQQKDKDRVTNVVLVNMQVMWKQKYVIYVRLENIDPVTMRMQHYVLNVQLDLHKQNLDKDLASTVVSANTQTEKNN